MSQKWFDCHGQELKAGDRVREVNTGKVELVYTADLKSAGE